MCPPCWRPGFFHWVGKILWRRTWQSIAVFWPGESPWTEESGGCSPWGCKELDMTELLSTNVKLTIVMRATFVYWVLNMYWRRQWHPTPVLLPGKSHGCRSLVGCSPWGCWELDMTERLHFHFSLSHIGEGNGNPLQCSCLENPKDGGAWWAAVYGVAQSQTRLKQQYHV